MAGEFCPKRNEDGRLCIMASGHYGDCVFSAVKPRPTPREALIHDPLATRFHAACGHTHPGGANCPLPTPAAMLGDALRHLDRARDLMRDAGLQPSGNMLYALSSVIQGVGELKAKREAEARAGGALPLIVAPTPSRPEYAATPDDGDCWTVGIGAPTHNLGELPGKCFTCAAHCKQRDPSPGVG